jgi:hypothetical protein
MLKYNAQKLQKIDDITLSKNVSPIVFLSNKHLCISAGGRSHPKFGINCFSILSPKSHFLAKKSLSFIALSS